LVSQLIDGKFPDFERIIPTEYTTRSLMETSELLKAVKLAALFANISQNIVKLVSHPGNDVSPGKLVISANAAELGDNTGEVDGIVHGEGGQVATNVKYLTDALNAIRTAQVAIEAQTAQSPVVFKPVGNSNLLQIVMPMSIRS
jgi:DNA polymerase-3 subunit beta